MLTCPPHHNLPTTHWGMNYDETSLCMASGNAPAVPSLKSPFATQMPDPMPTPPPTKCWSAPPRRMSGNFTPLVYSADGLASKDARKDERRLACILATKLDQAYSDTVNLVCVRMSLTIVRSNTLLLQSDRNHPLHHRAPSDGIAVASHDSFRNNKLARRELCIPPTQNQPMIYHQCHPMTTNNDQ
ncbi:hypothetical protein ACHAW6_004508 [Cyclotella cf. meneghiniana]